jgi:hypothetical protein
MASLRRGNTMKSIQRAAIAAAELLLISPAMLFFAALFARSIQPIQYEPAHTAQQIVNWYATSPGIGLKLLLSALPFTVLLVGCVVLAREWKANESLRQSIRLALGIVHTHLATLLIGAATLAAGGILAIVAVHVATD